MKYSEGTSFARADGSWLKVDIQVDDDDIHTCVAEWASDGPFELDSLLLSMVERYNVAAFLTRALLLRREVTEYQETAEAVRSKERGAELSERLKRSAAERSALRERVLRSLWEAESSTAPGEQ